MMQDPASLSDSPAIGGPPVRSLDVDPALKSLLASAIWWYIAGLAVLGATLGLLTGMSNSPVVAIVVPLLFALIAGSGGFYSTALSWNNREDLGKLKHLGIAVLVFSAAVMVSGNVGIAIRTGRIGHFALSTISNETAAAVSTRDAVFLKLLNRKMELAGFNDSDREVINRSALHDVKALRSRAVREEDLDLLDSAIVKVESAYRKTQERLERTEDNFRTEAKAEISDKEISQIRDLGEPLLTLRRTQFTAYAQHIRILKERLQHNEQVPWEAFQGLLDTLTATVQSDIKDEALPAQPRQPAILFGVDQTLAALLDLNFSIGLISQPIGELRWLDRQPYQDLDEQIKLTLSGGAPIRTTARQKRRPGHSATRFPRRAPRNVTCFVYLKVITGPVRLASRQGTHRKIPKSKFSRFVDERSTGVLVAPSKGRFLTL